MALRFILGTAGSGKTEFCLNAIRDELRRNPDGHTLIFLVPDQATFLLERELATTSGLGGIMRAQVLSFRRLAWNVFRDTGGTSCSYIGALGKKMILKKLLANRKKELRAFILSANQLGFLDMLSRTFSEMKRYLCTPEQLNAGAGFFASAPLKDGIKQHVLAAKLNDIGMLYGDFADYLGDKYLDPDDYLTLMAAKLSEYNFIQGAEIWIDGFTGFTPQEYLVLKQLLMLSRQVNVSLCLDDADGYFDQVDYGDCFHATRETHQKLIALADDLALPLDKPLNLPGAGQVLYRFKNSTELLFLAENSFKTIPPASMQEIAAKGDILLASAINRRAEVEGIARQILMLARTKGYRWREMAVILRDFAGYQELIETIFYDFDIPLFIDKKRSVLHHPLVELLVSGAALIVDNWSPESLFRVLKTDFFPIRRDMVDHLENYVIAHRIRGRAWLQKAPWAYHRQKTLGEDNELSYWEQKELAFINNVRDKVQQILLPFTQALKAAPAVKEKVGIVYQLIADLQVYEKLAEWATAAKEKSRLQEAREHAQVYDAVMRMLEEMVESLGGESISNEEFLQILQTGLEGIELGLIPPGLDQVVVVSLERSRTPNVKAAFLAGVTDGILPKRPLSDGIFTENERENLQKVGVALAPGEDRALIDEEYLVYIGLTRASEYLCVSYPLADAEGRAMLPSMVVGNLKKMFPRLRECLWALEPKSAAEPLEFLCSGTGSLPVLVGQLRLLKEGVAIDPLWIAAYNWFIEQQETREILKNMLGGIFRLNREEQLSQDTRKKISSENLRTSVSRLEKYQQCPFAYFLTYGLKLKRRLTNKLAGPDYGQFYHAALKDFLERIQADQIDLADLSMNEASEILTTVVNELAPQMQNELLLTSNRYKHLARKMQETLRSSINALLVHAARSKFRPVSMELSFGAADSKLPPLVIPLDGAAVEIMGKIDRVDAATDGDKNYLMVIDYKSGNAFWKLDDFYHGLSLQLLAYLLVCVENGLMLGFDNAIPAGIFYFMVHNPLLKWNTVSNREMIERALLKEYKLKGMILGDEKLIQIMDAELRSGWSNVLPVGFTKDGLYKNSSVFSEADFVRMREHFYRVVRDAGQKILAGDVSIHPYKKGNHKACTFCDYRDVCQFDVMMPENNYRLFANIPKDKVWEYLQEKSYET